MEQKYYVLAYYHFTAISDPDEEVRSHKEFFKNRDITSRIYISKDGINGQMSGFRDDALAYIDWMHSRQEFKDVYFKVHYWHENVFPRVIVKHRKQLVAIDETVDIKKTGSHLSPREWKEMLDNKDKVLIDVRNKYEWDVGHFDGAELPECDTFREFKQYAEDLQKRVSSYKTPIMMYCTGGIRCELYSAILKDKGFEHVYQLDGGVINYGLKEGSSKWRGKLFVFDDRLTVPISDEGTEVIGHCKHCAKATDNYYNCANMDCNELFLCCPECLHKHSGCCQDACCQAPRVRPYHHQDAHKPFRKYYTYFADRGGAKKERHLSSESNIN